jgi:hypothetical protein
LFTLAQALTSFSVNFTRNKFNRIFGNL